MSDILNYDISAVLPIRVVNGNPWRMVTYFRDKISGVVENIDGQDFVLKVMNGGQEVLVFTNADGISVINNKLIIAKNAAGMTKTPGNYYYRLDQIKGGDPVRRLHGPFYIV